MHARRPLTTLDRYLNLTLRVRVERHGSVPGRVGMTLRSRLRGAAA